MAETIKWGIMGSGAIVDRWMRGAAQCCDEMELVAISSRNLENARKKAERYSIPKVMTYEEMAENTEIQVIYIAALHTAHKKLAMLAMEHGKSILVEKPAGVNEAELREMISCAEENNVFFMEAVWTRFFPAVSQIKAKIKEGAIGKIRAMNTSFSFRTSAEDMEARLLNPNTAGGGLLDTGVYNLHFVNEILDKNPTNLIGLATMDSDENHIQVDEQAAYLAQYDEGELVTMTSGVRTVMIDTAIIYGTEGYIEIPSFWKPSKMKLVQYAKDGESSEDMIDCIDMPVNQKVEGVSDEGYQYEIRHVNQCIREDKKESSIMTWEKSVEVIKQCDYLRKQWGLKYPFEKYFQ